MTFAYSILGGALLVLIQPRFDLAFLAPFVLAPFVLAAEDESRWSRRFLAGWLGGAIAWSGSCYWIRFVIDHHGGLNYPLSLVGLLIFALYKGLQTAAFLAIARPLVHSPWALLLIPALWTGLERTHGPMGFAWFVLGNAAIDYPVVPRLAPVLGVYGCSYWLAMCGTLAAKLWIARCRGNHLLLRNLAPAVLLLIPLFLPGLPSGQLPSAEAAVLQPNIDLDGGWTRESARAFQERVVAETLAEALKNPRPNVITWPEMPAPLYFENDAAFRDLAQSVPRLSGRPFLFNTVTYNSQGAPLNSAILLAADGTPQERYDKMYLVPFGEFVPKWFSFVNRISDEAGDFAEGSRVVVFSLPGVAEAPRLGAFICYESAFPHLVRRFTWRGAQVLFNLSNDGYFGDRAAREQHLALARMRAIENRRWVVRPTNDGITASIDPAGRVRARLPEFQPLTARLPFGSETELTPYVRHGDWFAWSCLILAAGAALFQFRKFDLQTLNFSK